LQDAAQGLALDCKLHGVVRSMRCPALWSPVRMRRQKRLHARTGWRPPHAGLGFRAVPSSEPPRSRCYYFLLCKKGCACMYARQLCSLQMYVLQQPVFERRRPVVLPVLPESGSSETKARVMFDTIHNKGTLQLAELQVTSCAARACGPKSITTERCHLFFYLKINVKETTCSGSKLPISPLRRL